MSCILLVANFNIQLYQLNGVAVMKCLGVYSVERIGVIKLMVLDAENWKSGSFTAASGEGLPGSVTK